MFFEQELQAQEDPQISYSLDHYNPTENQGQKIPGSRGKFIPPIPP